MPDIPQEALQAAVEAVKAEQWRGGRPFAAHGNHQFDGGRAVCRGEVEAIVSVGVPAAVDALAGAGLVVVSAEDLRTYLHRGKDLKAEVAAMNRLRVALPEEVSTDGKRTLRQENMLDRLDGMLANLQVHIDQRAQELAQPLIDQAREAAAVEVKGAQGMQQRAEDLVTELRRQFTALERNRDRYRERAEAAEAAIDIARITMRSHALPVPAHPTDYQRGYQACVDHVTTELRNTTQEANRG